MSELEKFRATTSRQHGNTGNFDVVTLRSKSLTTDTLTATNLTVNNDLKVNNDLDVTGNITFGSISDAAATEGDIVYYNAAKQITKLNVGAVGQILTSNGTLPGWSSLVLPAAKGDLLTHNGAAAQVLASSAVNGQVLTVDTAQATGLKWATPSTGLTTNGDLLTYNGGDVRLPIGTGAAFANQMLRVNNAGTAPEWSDDAYLPGNMGCAGTAFIDNMDAYSGARVTFKRELRMDPGVPISLDDGVNGDIVYINNKALTRIAIGTAGQVLAVNSGATAPEWADRMPLGEIGFINNATTTTLTLQNQFYALGVTPTLLQSFPGGAFDVNSNGLRYLGTTTRAAHCAYSISYSIDTNTQALQIAVFQNGTIIANNLQETLVQNMNNVRTTTGHFIASLAQNDIVDVRVQNITSAGTVLTVKHLNLVAVMR